MARQSDGADALDVLAALARAFGARIAFDVAVWELVNTGELIPSHRISE
jgi:hypothetical protein